MTGHKRSFITSQVIALAALLLVCLTTADSHAEIYIWTDEHGNTVYGDEPQKSDQAKPVDLEPITILGFPERGPVTVQAPQTGPAKAYSKLSITSPVNDSTVRNNAGSVSISLSSEPKLIEGHQIQIYLDGSPYQQAQGSMSITLTNIDRGTHTISANLLDESGTTLIQSQNVVFHLHRFIGKN